MASLLPGAFGPEDSTDVNAVDVIRAKRDGGTLTDEQIRWFIAAYTDGEVADEQASALLMAIFFRGFEPARAGDMDRGDDRQSASASTCRR